MLLVYGVGICSLIVLAISIKATFTKTQSKCPNNCKCNKD